MADAAATLHPQLLQPSASAGAAAPHTGLQPALLHITADSAATSHTVLNTSPSQPASQPHKPFTPDAALVNYYHEGGPGWEAGRQAGLKNDAMSFL